ncbi:ArnT family glycosyltransferase [Gorillibacterium sp. sgz5001074]|uniref:ArnT family glycosyltransferase n=1 Tax=Gorillibacterium sp. sgz5001074 TaxID=3446695 RepID=UPI003F6803CA
MRTVRHTLVRGIQSMGWVALGLILLANIVFNSVITGNERLLIRGNNLLFAGTGAILAVVLLLVLFQAVRKLPPVLFLLVTQLLYGTAILGWIRLSRVVPFADQGSVYQAALNFNAGRYADFLKGGYLDQYHHQIPLTLMFALLLKTFGGGYQVLQGFIGLCTLGLNAGLYTLARELHSERAGRLAVLVSMLFVPTALLTIYVYGDIIGLCFSVWALFFIVRYGRGGRWTCLLAAAILIGIAMLFRTNMIILLAAMALYLLLKLPPRRWASVLLLLASLGGGYGLQAYAAAKTGFDPANGMPAVLFVNMGLEEGPRAEGWYNASTVRNYTASGRDAARAAELGDRLLGERLSYMADHPVYTARFFGRKFLTTWTEPTQEALYFTMPHNQSKEVSAYYKSGAFWNSLYGGPLGTAVQWFCKGIVLLVLTGAFFSTVPKGSRLSPETVLLLLAIGGTMVFHLAWETKSRYIYPAFLLMVPLAAGALAELAEALRERLLRRTELRQES